MTILNSLLFQTSSVRNICISFVASHLVLLLMWIFTLPVINNQIGTQVFDLQTFGYNISEAASIVDTLNNETRALYLFPQLTLLDLFYPFLLALFLSSLLFRLFIISKTASKLTSILLVVPFLAMIFDYAENICVILMITKTIELTDAIVFLSTTFTVLKGVLTSIAWIAILIYTIKWFRVKILGRNNKHITTH
ncbi:hypothetical protein [Arenibacter sp. ARW7G5Y1]|uniref:hypothetical protein n=1 Tax=Arenibacter sp. ARW7G5Y1 TaxID=2135619 RepID=UPI000D960371|nr:hypothetical protein [Arenibacter sp. ARW7G5Y1]PXX25740.1 hypothetical protein C7972_111158 [Arenibacter sp. ARW7G5Y1]